MSFNKYKHFVKPALQSRSSTKPLPIHFLTPHWQQLFWFLCVQMDFALFELHTNGTIWIYFLCLDFHMTWAFEPSFILVQIWEVYCFHCCIVLHCIYVQIIACKFWQSLLLMDILVIFNLGPLWIMMLQIFFAGGLCIPHPNFHFFWINA